MRRAHVVQKDPHNFADRQYMKDDASGKIIASCAHPIFWAPFVVVGDGH
jgi:CHAT domain-containing protein